MKLIDACFPEKQPAIPESLKRRIDIHYTCELTEVECDAFSRVLIGLERMLKRDVTIKSELWTHVLFAGSPLLIFALDGDSGGGFAPFTVYPVYKWRSSKYTKEQIILCMVEELCHCFWSIRDETRVKQKVIEFMKILGLSLSWPKGHQF